MPLDSSGTQLLDYALTVVNPLAKMGIVPISKAFVLRYKKDYLAAWTAAHPDSYAARLGHVKWKTVKHNPQRRTLECFLKQPFMTGVFAKDISAMPKALAALALLVHNEIPEAVFSVDYLDLDPVLKVSINGTNWCLGIWDNGKLKHIAKH